VRDVRAGAGKRRRAGTAHATCDKSVWPTQKGYLHPHCAGPDIRNRLLGPSVAITHRCDAYPGNQSKVNRMSFGFRALCRLLAVPVAVLVFVASMPVRIAHAGLVPTDR